MTFSLTIAQHNALKTLASDAKHNALAGGSRCVAGDTVLDGHTRTIAELAMLGEPIRVLTSWGEQWAEPPFRKGSALLWDVRVEGGGRIEVTDDHRFWSGTCWVRTRELSCGYSVAVRSSGRGPRGSSSAHGLSRFVAGVLCWTRRLAGSLARCFPCRRRCDRRPRRAEAGARVCRASQSGALGHTRGSLLLRGRASGWRESSTHAGHLLRHDEADSPSGPRSFHLSNSGAAALTCLDAEFLGRACGQIYARFLGLLRGRLQSDWRFSARESSEESCGVGDHQSRPLACPSPSNDIPNPDGYVLKKVLSVTATTVADFYTLHVPGAEQYFANGFLNHNSGKTFLLVRSILIRAMKAPKSRHAVFRYRFNAIKSSIIYDTLPKVMELCFPGLGQASELNKTDWFLQLPNGSEIWFGGLDDKERTEKILGNEFCTIYFNECSQIPYQSVITALTRLAQKTSLRGKAYYDLNPPSKQHWTYRLLVERKDPLSGQLVANPGDYTYFQINPSDNLENLPEDYLEMLDSLPDRQRQRFLLGQFADDSEGALWDDETLHYSRLLNASDLPDFKRIAIAVDPSGCSGEEDVRSDEVGIMVGAVGADGRGYLLEDLSGRHGPADWAQIVCDAFERHDADKVIGEDNYGGAMVEHTIRSVNPDIPYESVKATRGKVVRAEPISSLYHRGKIVHVGRFHELEEQLCGFTTSGYTGLRSPDRADAVVWLWTYLFPGMTQSDRKREWRPPKVVTAPRKSTRYARFA